jgi:hypothetical protein
MKRWVIPLALLVLAIGGTAWFLANFDHVPVRERVGPSGEARVRDFLAAERFAERMGMSARELRAVPDLDRLVSMDAQPAARGVLILPGGRQLIEAARIRRLVAWMQAGGHLIVEAESLGIDDPLLDSLGVERAQAPQPLARPAVAMPGGRSLAVAFPDRLSVATRVKTTLHAGDRLVSYPVGKGQVTVASSLSFARNSFIGANDHAEFLWALLQLTGAQALQVYVRPERLSLTGFLLQHALPALAAATALLALWLWRIAPRFGPVRPDAAPARRRLLDHLRASGRYFWAQGLRPRLVLATRDAALRALARSQPDFMGLSAKEQRERIAGLAGTDVEAARFLGAASAMRGADFITFVRHARDIHSALERGRR